MHKSHNKRSHKHQNCGFHLAAEISTHIFPKPVFSARLESAHFFFLQILFLFSVLLPVSQTLEYVSHMSKIFVQYLWGYVKRCVQNVKEIHIGNAKAASEYWLQRPNDSRNFSKKDSCFSDQTNFRAPWLISIIRNRLRFYRVFLADVCHRAYFSLQRLHRADLFNQDCYKIKILNFPDFPGSRIHSTSMHAYP